MLRNLWLQKNVQQKIVFHPSRNFKFYLSLDLGSEIRDPGSAGWVPFDPGIRNRFIPDPGCQIPDPKLILLIAY